MPNRYNEQKASGRFAMALSIRRMRKGDLRWLCRLLADPEVMRWLEPPYSAEQTEAFLTRAVLPETPLIYAAEEQGVAIGDVIYRPCDEDSLGSELCVRTDELADSKRRTGAQALGDRMRSPAAGNETHCGAEGISLSGDFRRAGSVSVGIKSFPQGLSCGNDWFDGITALA